MAKDKKELNGDSLEDLLREILDDCKQDIKEAEENIGYYKDEIVNSTTGKDVYGHLLNEALKIKGQTRDRVMKAVTMIKDRVRVKEMDSSGKDGMSLPSPHEMLKAMDELERNTSDDDDE